MSLRIRKGTEQQRLGIIFDLGEIIWTTDGEKLYVGDGITYGGKNVAAQLAGEGMSFNNVTGKLDSSATFTTDEVNEGSNNFYFTNQRAQSGVWAALQAGQSLGNVTFTYDDVDEKLYANVTLDGVGLTSVSQDTTPSLGGNLNLSNHNITGFGDINTSGNIVVTGTVSTTQGLGANLSLNGFNINGVGVINISGAISTQGEIFTSSTINASGGLGGNLNLNEFNIFGTGGINITGDITSSGTVSATSVLFNQGQLTIDSNQLTSNDTIQPPNTSNGAGNDGVIYIGDETLPATLWISSEKNFAVQTGLVGPDNDGTAVYFRTSRGTITEPTELSPGDRIAKNVAQGWDGEKYWHAGGYGIGTDPNELISVGLVPGRFEAQVRDYAGDVRSLFYTARGVLTGAVLQPTSFATTAARDAALSGNNGVGTPILQAGMMCFVADSDGGGTPAFMGYNGSAWVVLG